MHLQGVLTSQRKRKRPRCVDIQRLQGTQKGRPWGVRSSEFHLIWTSGGRFIWTFGRLGIQHRLLLTAYFGVSFITQWLSSINVRCFCCGCIANDFSLMKGISKRSINIYLHIFSVIGISIFYFRICFVGKE